MHACICTLLLMLLLSSPLLPLLHPNQDRITHTSDPYGLLTATITQRRCTPTAASKHLSCCFFASHQLHHALQPGRAALLQSITASARIQSRPNQTCSLSSHSIATYSCRGLAVLPSAAVNTQLLLRSAALMCCPARLRAPPHMPRCMLLLAHAACCAVPCCCCCFACSFITCSNAAVAAARKGWDTCTKARAALRACCSTNTTLGCIPSTSVTHSGCAAQLALLNTT